MGKFNSFNLLLIKIPQAKSMNHLVKNYGNEKLIRFFLLQMVKSIFTPEI